MSNQLTTSTEEPLTAQEIKFSNLVAKGYSLTTAYRQAFPAQSKRSYNYIRRLASDLITKRNISSEVEVSKERAARLARLAEERIEDTLVNGKSGKATNDVAMFMYDHANGKAVTKTVVEGRHVSINFNLAGTNEPIPQEILDQLKDD